MQLFSKRNINSKKIERGIGMCMWAPRGFSGRVA